MLRHLSSTKVRDRLWFNKLSLALAKVQGEVVSAIQTLIAGEPNKLDDATLESILSVVYYPEHLPLLNINITSTWFPMMESYTENYSVSTDYRTSFKNERG